MSSEQADRAGEVPPGGDQRADAEAKPRGEPVVRAKTNTEPDEVIQETSVTINEVGRPNYETEAAMRRGWLQELIRSSLALLFTVLLFATVGFACWGATTSHWDSVKELLQILLPAETALLGSATGFYYGSRR